MRSKGDWVSRWTPVVAVVAWLLANALDVFSVFLLLQMGGRLPFVRYHAAEHFLIYVGMRMLGTMAFCLLVFFAIKHWASVSRIAWGTLTACSLATAILAWLRLY